MFWAIPFFPYMITGDGILNHRGYDFVCFIADGILCDLQEMEFFVIYKGWDSVWFTGDGILPDLQWMGFWSDLQGMVFYMICRGWDSIGWDLTDLQGMGSYLIYSRGTSNWFTGGGIYARAKQSESIAATRKCQRAQAGSQMGEIYRF